MSHWGMDHLHVQVVAVPCGSPWHVLAQEGNAPSPIARFTPPDLCPAFTGSPVPVEPTRGSNIFGCVFNMISHARRPNL